MALENITMTKLRRLILDILLQAQEPVKAYDLLERAREKGHRLTASTIYRILDYLEASGLIHRVSSLNAFLACVEGRQAHHPLIVVCPQCQKTQEVNDEILSKSIFQRLNALGLNISTGSVEIRGLCPQCAPEI
ncbi:MAG: transcriptional repressor [Deltaproteobacteria bacterium]|jgi:Fur family zinc uptake transcriptional regulator|nr:transcriptional repressor [Deltaproteobacteria bacterium]